MTSAPLTGFGWNGYIVDENGQIVDGAEITVRDAIFGGILTGLTDLNNLPLSNPFTIGADGYAAFRINKTGPNWVNIEATKGAFSATFDRISIGSAAGYNIGNTNQNHLMVKNDIELAFKAKTFDNLTAVTDPTINDDSNDGYTVGSQWVNTASSPMDAFVCLDATVGAAVWVTTTLTIGELGTMALLDTGSGGSQFRNNTDNEAFFDISLQNNLIAGADPTVTNDSGEGYSVLSVWINQTSSPPEMFTCLDSTLGAAVWRSNTADIDSFGTMALQTAGTGDTEYRNNVQNAGVFQPIAFESSTDPTVNDDSDDGFVVGSRWLNTSSSPVGVFTATDVTVGAAVWLEEETGGGGGIDLTMPTTWTAGIYDVIVGTEQVGTSPVHVSFSIDLGDDTFNIKSGVNVGGSQKFAIDGVMVGSSDTDAQGYIVGIVDEPVGAAPPDFLNIFQFSYDPGTGGSGISNIMGSFSPYFGSEDGAGNGDSGLNCLGTGVCDISHFGGNSFKVSSTGFNYTGLAAYATDALAGVGGLVTGDIYYTVITAPTADFAVGDQVLKMKV
ncbi:MAG: hypothetical protein CL811_07325 [Colwelliaceae bacterium]|nr:hypothetical protein [Colwelliaceae bacterium]